MADQIQNSVTRLIARLAAGDVDEAARQLWGRYFDRLERIARVRLRQARCGVADGEDAALSAFDSLCRGVAQGRFPELGSRDVLWRLLVTIASRKAIDHIEREGRQKRGGGRVLGEADLAGPGLAGEAVRWNGTAGWAADPQDAAEMKEEIRRLLDRLPDESLRLVALLKLEGYTNEEIARALDCAVRSVERKLGRIRLLWGDAEGAS